MPTRRPDPNEDFSPWFYPKDGDLPVHEGEYEIELKFAITNKDEQFLAEWGTRHGILGFWTLEKNGETAHWCRHHPIKWRGRLITRRHPLQTELNFPQITRRAIPC